MTVLYIVGGVAIAFLLTGWFLIRKRAAAGSRFLKSLGWYELIAGIYGIAMTLYLLSSPLGLGVVGKIIIGILGFGSGGLGIWAGILLLMNRSSRPSVWWGLVQLPWLSFNLHWLVLSYYCELLFGFPVRVILALTNELNVKFGFEFHPLGVYFNFDMGLQFPGEGFEMGIGINLAALFFLILLRKARQQSGR